MSATVAALVAALIAPLGAYFLAARQFSGKIDNSDAKELWAESRSIRDWSQERIHELNEVVGRLEARVGALESSNDALFRENRDLTEQVRTLTEENRRQKEQIDNLGNQLTTARRRIAELEAHNG